jgi:chromosome segregation ATPase
MYIGIGFLLAGLLVIGVIPLVHARAVRLTMRRLEADNPLSMAEIAAEKDQLRAEFAMTMSRLEMTVEQLKAKTTNQLAEIGKNSEAIGRIKFELSEKTAALLALEAKEKQLSDDLAATQSELADKTAALEQAERAPQAAVSNRSKTVALFDALVGTGEQRSRQIATRRRLRLVRK